MKAESGKMIPLEPGTRTPHKCPEKQEAQTTTAPPEKHETLASLEDIEKAELARPRDFDEEKIKTDIKLINEWARKTAHDFNWKTLDQTETMEDRRARNIAENVDKKQLFDMFFKLKYETKKDSVDNLP